VTVFLAFTVLEESFVLTLCVPQF